MSYTWGHSKSPAYAFKTRKAFDQRLRDEIGYLFSRMAYRKLAYLADNAVVIGVSPRRTFQWGMQDHLNDLLLELEEVNFLVLRDVLAFDASRLVVAAAAAAKIRNRPVIIVDNLVNSRRTVRKVVTKLTELGCNELHLCMMGRWIEGLPDVIRVVSEYRSSLCPDPSELDTWYRNAFT